MTRVRASLAAVTLALLAGCAGHPAREPPPTYAMVPGTRAVPPAPIAPDPGTELDQATAAGLVTLPVPPESSPAGELENVFERIRLGYGLADVENPAVDQQVRAFASMPEYLDRSFERAERYLYYIVRELEARQMPLELAMLPAIESAFNPYAYSRARAAGIWQFIAPTARRYEVRVNWWQDGRRDIVDSTRAALDYLSALHTRFRGDWLLAIAAYNCGETAVERAIDRNRSAGRPTDFFHLTLPTETRAYVPKLLAMARIVANPEAYGLEFAAIANKPYFAQVEIGSQLDLRVAATLLGVTENELHVLNPAFNRWATDPDGPYHLLVPFDSATRFAQAVTSLPIESRMPVERVRIENGETVARLARERNIPVATIRRLNRLVAGDFKMGDEVMLPASRIEPLKAGLVVEGETRLTGMGSGRRHTYVVRRGDTLTSIAQRHHVGIHELARLNGLAASAHLQAGNRLFFETRERTARGTNRGRQSKAADAGQRKVSYVVKRGDTLRHISQRFSVSVSDLRAWNGLPNAALHRGQKLVIYIPAERDYGG